MKCRRAKFTWPALIVLAMWASGCDDRAPVAQESGSREGAPLPTPAAPPVLAIMHEKLRHSQTIVEGLTLADFDRIANSAQALRATSQQSAWLVNDSAAYLAMSARFREICDDLTSDAKAHELEAAADDYAVLTHACVSCHTYLRRERETRDMPGRVSLLERLTHCESLKGESL